MTGLVVEPRDAPLTVAGIEALLENPVPVIEEAAESVAVVAVAESCKRYQTVGLSAATMDPYGSLGVPLDAL